MQWLLVITFLIVAVLAALMLTSCAPVPQIPEPQLTTCEAYNLRMMRGEVLSDAEADHLLRTCPFIVVPI